MYALQTNSRYVKFDGNGRETLEQEVHLKLWDKSVYRGAMQSNTRYMWRGCKHTSSTSRGLAESHPGATKPTNQDSVPSPTPSPVGCIIHHTGVGEQAHAAVVARRHHHITIIPRQGVAVNKLGVAPGPGHERGGRGGTSIGHTHAPPLFLSPVLFYCHKHPPNAPVPTRLTRARTHLHTALMSVPSL